jgi:hypothetical protein
MLFKKKSSNEPRRARQPIRTEGMGSKPVFSYHARSARSEAGGERRASKLLWSAAPSKKPPSPRPSFNNSSKRFLMVVLAILGIALAVNSLMLSRDPEVLELADSSGRRLLLRSQDAYYQAARGILGGSLANTNKLTVDTARVAQAMKKQFPELEQVTVTLPLFGHKPVIYIQPAQPAILLKDAGVNVFVVSDSGRVLAEVTNLSRVAKLGLVLVEDQSGLPLKPGTAALPSADVAFITELVGQLKAKGLTPSAVVLPKGTSELDVRIKGSAYLIKFNLRGDARAEAGAFLAVKRHLEREKKTPASYIDVRVENRAYYR